MKRVTNRAVVVLLTFTLGVGLTAFVRFLRVPATHQEIATMLSDDNQQTAEVVRLPVGPEDYRPGPVSISPHEIKRLIDENNKGVLKQPSAELDFEPIWQRLNITFDWESFLVTKCNRSCEAQISNLELDGQQGRETLCELSFGSAVVYLIFKQDNNTADTQWSLLGYIPSFYASAFVGPSRDVVIAGQKRWLVIESNGGHGSGYGLYYKEWYEIGERGVRQVFAHLSSLYDASWSESPGISSKTKILKAESKGGEATVVLQYSNSFEIHPAREESLRLWTAKRKVTYVMKSDSSEFVIDPAHSEMTEAELDALEGFDEGQYLKDVLKYNYRELMQMATGKNAKRREWLRTYLDKCAESAEKQSLQKALE